jgi:hypothetical protein
VTDADPTQAIRIVARRVVALAATGGIAADWENYPDIGVEDWDAVMVEARWVVRRADVEDADFVNAYRELARRAEGVEA